MPDQQATLRDFYRLLRPGGVIGFSEPGPQHSLTTQSQYEMKNYGVIENDIVMAAIASYAQDIGFSPPEISYATSPRITDPARFGEMISGNVDASVAKSWIDSDAHHHANARCFFLEKPGASRMANDSRSPDGLSYSLAVVVDKAYGGEITGSITITNTGTRFWLPADHGTGAVNLGVHLYADDDQLLDLDYARISLGGDGVGPGHQVDLTFILPHPGRAAILEFDAVAEGVAWFNTLGNEPVRIKIGV